MAGSLSSGPDGWHVVLGPEGEVMTQGLSPIEINESFAGEIGIGPEVAGSCRTLLDVAAAGTLLSWDHRHPDALRWTKALRALVQGTSAKLMKMPRSLQLESHSWTL